MPPGPAAARPGHAHAQEGQLPTGSGTAPGESGIQPPGDNPTTNHPPSSASRWASNWLIIRPSQEYRSRLALVSHLQYTGMSSILHACMQASRRHPLRIARARVGHTIYPYTLKPARQCTCTSRQTCTHRCDLPMAQPPASTFFAAVLNPCSCMYPAVVGAPRNSAPPPLPLGVPARLNRHAPRPTSPQATAHVYAACVCVCVCVRAHVCVLEAGASAMCQLPHPVLPMSTPTTKPHLIRKPDRNSMTASTVGTVALATSTEDDSAAIAYAMTAPPREGRGRGINIKHAHTALLDCAPQRFARVRMRPALTRDGCVAWKRGCSRAKGCGTCCP